MDISQKLSSIEKEIQKIKTSQDIGNTSSVYYKVGSLVLTATKSQTYSTSYFPLGEMTFESQDRSFPHFIVVPENISVTSGYTGKLSMRSESHTDYVDFDTGSMTTMQYLDTYIYPSVPANTQITIRIEANVYADTPGIFKVELW